MPDPFHVEETEETCSAGISLSSVDWKQVQVFIKQRFAGKRIDRMLFVNPPDGESNLFRFQTAIRRRYPNYPPYGPAVLAQHLRSLKIEPKILNLNHEILKSCHHAKSETDFHFDETWQKLLSQSIADFKPNIVGVTCMFTMTHESLRRTCQFLSKFQIPLVIGGVHVTNDVERVLNDIPEAHIAFLRESDLSLKIFCQVVNGQLPVEQLGQIILNDSQERIRVLRECRPNSSEMDVVPAYDLFDISDLSKYGVVGNFHGFKSKDTRFATVLSNRGCRARCTFCSVRNFNGSVVRRRSVESVLDELECLHKKYGIGHIVWLDDDLLNNEERALALFRGMSQRKLGLTWDATNGVIAASCTDEMVSAMVESGGIALNIGMESGNPEMLKRIKKPGTVKTFLKAAEVFHRHPQIHTRVFLMIGFPGETLRMILDTINVARQMDLDWYGITPLQPLPNTPIYDSMIEQGLIQTSTSSEVRFQSGGYGKQDEIDLGLRLATVGFEEAFRSIPMDAIPTRKQIDDIWFYMNYHLNFHRLFSEERPLKMRQQLMNLKALSDVISPEHGFALYFMGYLHYKLDGIIPTDVIERLEKKITESSYWAERFRAFGLSASDLTEKNFKNKEIPRLIAGQLPPEE